MPSLCLCMIVKNESAVIARCLQSAKPIIDSWIVCDTGSTDGTKDIVTEMLRGVPGELHERPWVDFAHNRTEAISLARAKADYVLVVDADMVVNVHGPFKEHLTADSYLIRYEGALDYRQAMLLSSRHDWSYFGVTHEYIHAPGASVQEPLDALTLTHYCDGASRPDKLRRDIALLEDGLAREPDNARYMFYLAQSYREAGQVQQALDWYRRRVEAGGWRQEVWYSLYQIGRLLDTLGHDWKEVVEALLAAYEYDPTRLEPLYLMVRRYREHRQYNTGYLLSRVLPETAYPRNALFVEKEIYTHKLPLEYGICCHHVGRFSEAIRVNNDLLDCPTVPPDYRDAAIRNRRFSLDAVHKKSSAPSPHRNRLKVLVPFHNPGRYLQDCLESLLSQDFDHFQVLLLDDASTDDSPRQVPLGDPRVTLIRNEQRLGALKNLHRLLRDWCEADDVAVVVDGDDWLACPDALSHIDRIYREHDCWVMYGQFRYSTGALGFCKPYPDAEAFARLRQVWYASHVKTFRAGLYHRIEDQDPAYACMKDANGHWFTAANDMAVMYPLMEMAGFERVIFNDRVLYVYNVENPLSVFRTRRDEELHSNRAIVAKAPFQKIQSYRA